MAVLGNRSAPSRRRNNASNRHRNSVFVRPLTARSSVGSVPMVSNSAGRVVTDSSAPMVNVGRAATMVSAGSVPKATVSRRMMASVGSVRMDSVPTATGATTRMAAIGATTTRTVAMRA